MAACRQPVLSLLCRLHCPAHTHAHAHAHAHTHTHAHAHAHTHAHAHALVQQQRHYAKPVGGAAKKGKVKIGPTVEKVRLPVETDAEKLVTYVCCSHPVKENREDVKLKDDSEYPEWLWTLRTGKPPPLEELDPNTKQYWKRLRNMALWEKNKLMKLRKI